MAKKNIDPETRKKNLEQQKSKSPEFHAARKAFDNYFKENGLDPTKDYTKDKKHGEMVKKLLAKLNKERDKLSAQYPETDPKGAMKLIKKEAKKVAKKEKKVDALQKHLKEEAANEEVKKERKVSTKYDYPLIDGKEMTPEQKKKYRMEQRRTAKKGNTKENASSAEPQKGRTKEERIAAKKAKKAAAKAKSEAHKEED
jgi:hypothetical protein